MTTLRDQMKALLTAAIAQELCYDGARPHFRDSFDGRWLSQLLGALFAADIFKPREFIMVVAKAIATCGMEMFDEVKGGKSVDQLASPQALKYAHLYGHIGLVQGLELDLNVRAALAVYEREAASFESETMRWLDQLGQQL
ncbi:MAG: hypothetical protein WA082_00620 [Candidatus Moraniibacteriota bacterium]